MLLRSRAQPGLDAKHIGQGPRGTGPTCVFSTLSLLWLNLASSSVLVRWCRRASRTSRRRSSLAARSVRTSEVARRTPAHASPSSTPPSPRTWCVALRSIVLYTHTHTPLCHLAPIKQQRPSTARTKRLRRSGRGSAYRRARSFFVCECPTQKSTNLQSHIAPPTPPLSVHSAMTSLASSLFLELCTKTSLPYSCPDLPRVVVVVFVAARRRSAT